ncbi:MAG: LysM peptidoglycan-binding domain-containing protein [Verrucomicrobiota bacterium]
MIRKLVFALPLVLLIAPASGRADLAVEYEQVRRIALRDPKVQRAFEKAHQQLEEKIVELDPALADYQPYRKQGFREEPRESRQESGREARREFTPSREATAGRPALTKAVPSKPVPKPAPRVTRSTRSHVLAPGETLGSVAAKYRVTIRDLRAVNQIRDDRRLSVGQVLSIPANRKGL